MSIDMYSEKTIEATTLIKQVTGLDWFYALDTNSQETLERFIACMDKVKADILASLPSTAGQAPVREVLDERLQNWIDVIHDNERSMGDRLQSLSSTFAGILRGDTVDKYPLRAIREQLNWLPISTAPKDGTAILVVMQGYTPSVARWVAGYWMTADMEADYEDDELDLQASSEWNLTHWMPLPAAPVQTEGV